MKFLMNALIAIALAGSSALAVVPESYPSTVLNNDQEVNALFQKMETSFKQKAPWKLQFGSECTARAETWTYEFDKVHEVKAQKVFVFYTIAYHNYYYQKHKEKFIWWFHVSPYVLVKGKNGSPEERVMDREFSDQPQTMQEWTDLFIESKEKCIENVPYANFEGDVTGDGASYNKNAHCYIVRAPMYDMYPADADARERGTYSAMDWNMNQVRIGAKALTPGARAKYFKRVGL